MVLKLSLNTHLQTHTYRHTYTHRPAHVHGYTYTSTCTHMSPPTHMRTYLDETRADLPWLKGDQKLLVPHLLLRTALSTSKPSHLDTHIFAEEKLCLPHSSENLLLLCNICHTQGTCVKMPFMWQMDRWASIRETPQTFLTLPSLFWGLCFSREKFWSL